MTIHAQKVGRDLHITVEGLDDPFVIRPLPGRAGLQITDTYLNTLIGSAMAEESAAALLMAVDGGVLGDDGHWSPVPEADQTNMNRMGLELSQQEAESVQLAAFFWQTVLGVDGVNAYIEEGEGIAGTLKASRALTARLGRLTRRTSPSSE